MPAPLAKGLIIAASVIVAAGFALYESPQVRQWVDQHRRKIAVALHNLGDDIQPNSQSRTSRSRSRSPVRDIVEERRRRHEESIRRSRAELIKKAREEGIAVDLDELARLGTELHELQHAPRSRSNTANANRSFDELVGDDGMLKLNLEKQEGTVVATGASRSGQEQLRFRGRGVEAPSEGVRHSNPFADDEAEAVLDQKLIGAHDDDVVSQTIPVVQTTLSRESTATLEGDRQSEQPAPPAIPAVQPAPQLSLSQHLLNLSSGSPRIEAIQTASILSIPSEGSDDEEDMEASFDQTQSFHSFQLTPSSTPALSRSNTLQIFPGDATPTDDGFSNASVIDSQADDIARLTESLHSMQDHDDDSMSEAFSEIGAGQSTPGSWTDVGSDDGSEMGMH